MFSYSNMKKEKIWESVVVPVRGLPQFVAEIEQGFCFSCLEIDWREFFDISLLAWGLANSWAWIQFRMWLTIWRCCHVSSCLTFFKIHFSLLFRPTCFHTDTMKVWRHYCWWKCTCLFLLLTLIHVYDYRGDGSWRMHTICRFTISTLQTKSCPVQLQSSSFFPSSNLCFLAKHTHAHMKRVKVRTFACVQVSNTIFPWVYHLSSNLFYPLFLPHTHTQQPQLYAFT